MAEPSGSRPRRRDRHGRGVRGPLAWPQVPAMTSRRDRFDDLVLDSAARLERHLGPQGTVDFAVEDVPPEPAAGLPQDVSFGRLYPAASGHAARIVVYRRPLESRALDGRELATMVHEVVLEQVAALLGKAPEDLDPRYGTD